MTKKAGVIGHPIAHSKSPLIHNHWLKKYGIDGDYRTYDILPENLERDVVTMREDGVLGFNVTIPHKENIIDICTTLNDEARQIGAVNTVVLYPGGEIEGRNTDAYGFITNITQSYPSHPFKNAPAVVIGAGGAARAAAYALKKQGVPEVRIVNRTIDRAEILADDFGLRVFEWEKRGLAIKDCTLVVNTTSLGMTGQPALELDLTYLFRNALVYDLVYKPLETNLLRQASARGNPILTGIGMLLHQARPAFQAWFGVQPEIDDDLRQKVLA